MGRASRKDVKRILAKIEERANDPRDPQKDEEFERKLTEDKQYERFVVDLESELSAWLNKADNNDAIRVVSGGPGSGKSSFAKIFAAKQALFLHHLRIIYND